jgi:heme/copper-type cytochrome/quinol oxidase subunit 3
VLQNELRVSSWHDVDRVWILMFSFWGKPL